jgi:hypothetical protein
MACEVEIAAGQIARGLYIRWTSGSNQDDVLPPQRLSLAWLAKLPPPSGATSPSAVSLLETSKHHPVAKNGYTPECRAVRSGRGIEMPS